MGSTPPSPPQEGHTKQAHDPAQQAGGDVHAGGAGTSDTVGQEMANTRGPTDDPTTTPDMCPATDRGRGAGLTERPGQRSDQTAAGDETEQPGAFAAASGAEEAGREPRRSDAGITPENPGAIVISTVDTHAPGRTSELVPVASSTSSGSMTQLQPEWASASLASSGAATGGSATAGTLDTVQALFADHRD